jgi:CRISPR-associated endonuclease Cas1
MDRQHAITANEVAEALDITFMRDPENSTICVVDGYGVRISTHAGRLVVADGIGRARRHRTFNRATHGLARLVVTAGSGHLTIDALRWLETVGVGLVVLDPSTGNVVTASTRVANDDARLRRAQALAPGTSTGLEIARYLTEIKLAGQAQIAAQELNARSVSERIQGIAAGLADSATLEEVRQLEAAAANLYWSAWETVSLSFVKKDADRVPDNWLRFEGRRSAVNPGGARNATDPANALINYLYRLLEAEGHIATQAVGLDPGLGVLHADSKGRASFVLDLIESGRPIAERHLLRILESTSLRWRDFDEDGHGVVRVLSPLTHRLAEAMPAFGAGLAPVVERIARILGSASPYDIATPSVLTREKHKAAARRRSDESLTKGDESLTNRSVFPIGPGIDGLEPRAKRRQKPPPELEAPLPLPICKGCGTPLTPEPDRRRRRGAYCPGCLADRRAELGSTLPGASRKQSVAFEASTGTSPTHNAEITVRRRRANAEQRAQQTAWEASEADDGHDEKWFRSEVLPVLASLTLTQIATATGMSTSAASKIRAGRLIPHRRHWTALAKLTASTQH